MGLFMSTEEDHHDTDISEVCNITNITDACKINNCIKKITGQDSDSASPTDIWFIDFNHNVTYDGELIENGGFLKIFFNYSSIMDDSYKKDELLGLEYELKIYKDIISKIIEYNISPNFIKYYASGIGCSYDSLLKLLQNHLYDDTTDKLLNKEDVKTLLNRNLKYILNGWSERHSINTIRYRLPPINQFYIDMFNNCKYNLILNESVPKNSLKFNKWCSNNYKSPDFIPNLWSILFQISTACYVLQLTKTVHNDLHSGNIWIIKLSKPTTFIYIINNKKYKITTIYKACLYDFDRSYTKRFGKNILIEDYLCDEYDQCNELYNSLDFIKVLCYIIRPKLYFKNLDDSEKILNCVVKDEKYKKLLMDVYEYSDDNKVCFFRYLTKHALNKKKFFNNLNTLPVIIDNISSYIPSVKIFEDIDINKYIEDKNIYICNEKNFYNDGIINMVNYEKDFNNIDELFKSKDEEKTKKTKRTKKTPDVTKTYNLRTRK